MNDCTAVIGSVNAALKAQKILLQKAIRSVVVKLDSSVTKKGCAYGIEFDKDNYSNVNHLLETSNIKVSRYVMEGDKL